MTRRALRFVALAVTLFSARAASAQIPETVARRQFTAWLEAFNSGDRERIRRFLEASYPSANLDGQMNFRLRTGGFEFRSAEQATATSFTGLVQESNSDQFARFNLTVEATEPHKITQFGLSAIPRPAEFPVPRLSETELISALRAKLDQDAADDRFAGSRAGRAHQQRHEQSAVQSAYGLADREKKIANTLDTRFRIGSMNKMFTAIAHPAAGSGRQDQAHRSTGQIHHRLSQPGHRWQSHHPSSADAHRRHGRHFRSASTTRAAWSCAHSTTT